MPGERLSRALLLDPTAIPGGAACFADARPIGVATLPILLGWRRAGGGLVVGTSEEAVTTELWGAAKSLAESTAEWTVDRWDVAFRAFWTAADPSLRNVLAERLPLPAENEWSLASWSEAVWGTFDRVMEPPAVAVVGSSVPEDVVDAILALEGLTRSAAFTFQPLGESGERIRCSLVAGILDPVPERALPGEIDGPVSPGRIAAPRDPEELLRALERVASGSEAKATWFRRDWVRFEGPCGAVRGFPRGEGVWLQLAGADEGALAGLRFRHGLTQDLMAGAPSDAPPGAHFFLRDVAALTPSIEALLRQWLRGTG